MNVDKIHCCLMGVMVGGLITRLAFLTHEPDTRLQDTQPHSVQCKKSPTSYSSTSDIFVESAQGEKYYSL